MPTGYTAAIKDGITFEQFAMGCARGMGALIMMRDEPADAPIPQRFEPETAYHDKAINEAISQLAWLRQMTESEAQRRADKEYEMLAAQQAELVKKSANLRTKYSAILDQARAWVPPTPDHISMKGFMIKQITESIEFDCNEQYYRDHPVARLTGFEWAANKIAKCGRDIAYHSEQRLSEIDRTEKRNDWLLALRESLGTAK